MSSNGKHMIKNITEASFVEVDKLVSRTKHEQVGRINNLK